MSKVIPSSTALVEIPGHGILIRMEVRESNYPQFCINVGLDCETCTGETARQVAQTCRGLRGKAIGQLFVQIHPHSACSRMHAHFAACYRDASREAMAAMA
jgi:hypothetical protein